MGGFSQRAQMLLRDYAPASGADSAAALSLPVAIAAGQGGQPMDALFLYNETPGGGRPFAWAVFEAGGGKLVSFSHCGYADFVPTGDYPPDMPIDLNTPHPLPPSQMAEGRREMFTLYERMRDFLLHPTPGEEQREMLTRYATLFEAYACLGHRPFYKALAPGFIEWLGFDWEGPVMPAACGQSSAPGTVEELRELFLQKIQTDAHKQQLFDQMHTELVQHKNNLLSALTRPLEGDVIKAIDDIDKAVGIYRSRQYTPDNYRRMFALFEGVRTDLADLLYRNGVEPYTCGGNNVDVARQKIIDTLPTDKKRQDKKIATRHATGWEKDGKIIRPERVSVYVYQSKGEQKEAQSSENADQLG